MQTFDDLKRACLGKGDIIIKPNSIFISMKNSQEEHISLFRDTWDDCRKLGKHWEGPRFFHHTIGSEHTHYQVRPSESKQQLATLKSQAEEMSKTVSFLQQRPSYNATASMHILDRAIGRASQAYVTYVNALKPYEQYKKLRHEFKGKSLHKKARKAKRQQNKLLKSKVLKRVQPIFGWTKKDFRGMFQKG